VPADDDVHDPIGGQRESNAAGERILDVALQPTNDGATRFEAGPELPVQAADIK
jgi:hypothetical protein